MGSAIHKARSRRQVCWLFASRLLQSERAPGRPCEPIPTQIIAITPPRPPPWASASLSPSSSPPPPPPPPHPPPPPQPACMRIMVKAVTKSWGGENSLKLDQTSNNPIRVFRASSIGNHATKTFGPFCMEFGEHTADLHDSYGDGWHGGYIVISEQASGRIVQTVGSDFTSGRTKSYHFLLTPPQAGSSPPSSPLIEPGSIGYCHVKNEYYENGRTNFSNDVCGSCTLAQCRARCDSISVCVGFDTSVPDEVAKGTCWMKSHISIESKDIRSANGGPRTTYFNSRLPRTKTRCTPEVAPAKFEEETEEMVAPLDHLDDKQMLTMMTEPMRHRWPPKRLCHRLAQPRSKLSESMLAKVFACMTFLVQGYWPKVHQVAIHVQGTSSCK